MPEKPREPVDDGRTIADMNVEGMPWYVPPEKKALMQEPVTFSGWREQLSVMFQVWKVSLVAGGIIFLGIIIVILLLLFFWT